MSEPTAEQIDAGAEALRKCQMSGRITLDWKDTPNSAKHKWRRYAELVLKAAFAVGAPNAHS